jgi:hypothetical protein
MTFNSTRTRIHAQCSGVVENVSQANTINAMTTAMRKNAFTALIHASRIFNSPFFEEKYPADASNTYDGVQTEEGHQRFTEHE